jgi:CubicO group peptidase (beta-lactamase class C family)
MAKSIVHALVGLLVGEGRLDPAAPAAVPAWQSAGDPRAGITLDHLLRMLDGLEFVEFDPDSGRADVSDMLQGAGREDVAAYAEARASAHPPGRFWSYSSGTTIVICALLGRLLGGGREEMERFMRGRLFDPIGMESVIPRFDPAGTWLGSSYLFATARDFARFGLLYLRDGVWDGRRILPSGWVDHGRTPTPESWGVYGAHWWLARDGTGTFSANGFDGQHIVIVPRRDLVLVRLGISTPVQRTRLLHTLKEVAESFPPGS